MKMKLSFVHKVELSEEEVFQAVKIMFQNLFNCKVYQEVVDDFTRAGKPIIESEVASLVEHKILSEYITKRKLKKLVEEYVCCFGSDFGFDVDCEWKVDGSAEEYIKKAVKTFFFSKGEKKEVTLIK